MRNGVLKENKWAYNFSKCSSRSFVGIIHNYREVLACLHSFNLVNFKENNMQDISL